MSVVNKGFIFQTISIFIEFLNKDDWDEVIIDLKTNENKIEILSYMYGKVLSLTQIKSVDNSFRRSDVKQLLKHIRNKNPYTDVIYLHIINDKYALSYIQSVHQDIKIGFLPLESLQTHCIEVLALYLDNKELAGEIKEDDIEFIYDKFISAIEMKSSTHRRISNAEFHTYFEKSIPKHLLKSIIMPNTAKNPENKDPHTLEYPISIIPTKQDIDIYQNKHLVNDRLTQQVAIDMFYTIYGRDKEHKFEEMVIDIINSINRYELPVILIAKAAREADGTLSDFYKNLQENGYFEFTNRGHVESDAEENRAINYAIMKIIKLSFISKEQRRIMKLFTIFSAEKVIYHKVVEWASFDNNELMRLVKLGWLDLRDCGYLVRKDIKETWEKQLVMENEEVNLEDYGNLLEKVIDTESYISESMTYDLVRERIIFAEDIANYLWRKSERITENLVNDNRCLIDTRSLLNHLAVVFRELHDYTKAMEYNQKSLIISERVLGPDHPEVSLVYNSMAGVCRMQHSYEKAFYYYRKAKSICERVLGRKHPGTAITYNNMAVLFLDWGDYDKALDYCLRALDIREKYLGKDYPETAATYRNIGLVYFAMNKYAKALAYFQKALDIQVRVLGTDKTITALTYSDLAKTLLELEDYKSAQDYYQKALLIYEHVLGTNSITTASLYDNIAELYKRFGDYEKAQYNCQKALLIYEHVLGTEHITTASIYGRMSGILRLQGCYEKALEYCQKDLTIKTKVLGLEDLNIAYVYDNIAVINLFLGDFEKSREFFLKAISIEERVLGPEHISTAETYDNYALWYMKQGDYKNAQAYYLKAVSIKEHILGTNHTSTATSYNNLALVYAKIGAYHNALDYYRKALSIDVHVFGTHHPETASVYNNISSLYVTLGDYDKALKYVQISLDISIKTLGDDHPDTILVRENMEMLLRYLNKYD